MNSTDIIIPFDFPFAILEHRNNSDSKKKLVYAVADGQYTYGPLSLFQYNNDEKYSNIIRDDKSLVSLPCKEFYIIEPGFSTDGAIEINDTRRGRIYVREIEQEPQQVQMKELIQEITECRNELRSLKSIVLSEERISRRLSSIKQQPQSTVVKRNISNVNTPPPLRSQSVTTNRTLLRTIKSSGYGQQSPTPKRSLRK